MDQLGYIWNENWIHKFETPYSIFGKFVHANHIGLKDFFSCFSEGNTSAKNLPNYSSREKSLISLSSISSRSSMGKLGIDIVEYNQKMIEIIAKVGINGLDISESFRRNITYCPKCRQLGYHSYFHQLHHFNHCVFHPEEHLTDACPNCNGQTNQYELQDKGGFNLCKCGTPFVKENKEEPLFLLWKRDLELCDPIASKWINLSKDDLSTHHYFVLDLADNLGHKMKQPYYDKTSIAELIIESLSKENATLKSNCITADELKQSGKYEANTVKTYAEQLQKSNPLATIRDVDSDAAFQYDIYNLCTTVRNNISGKALKLSGSHSKCVKTFDINNFIETVCTFELAHKLWELECGGMIDVNHVSDNSETRFSNVLTYYQFPVQAYIKEILNELLNNSKYQEIRANLLIKRFIVRNITTHLLQERYIQWQYFVKGTKELKSYNRYECSTNFLLKIPKTSGLDISFHYNPMNKTFKDLCAIENKHYPLKFNIYLNELELFREKVNAYNCELRDKK